MLRHSLPIGAATQRPTPNTIITYGIFEGLTELLIFLSLIFAPWAFGTTQPWSIWTMNAVGYMLGLLFAAKLFIRQRLGYQICFAIKPPKPDSLTRALAGLTVLILIYTLVGALNARANYDPIRMDFSFRPHLKWLPHSYDQVKSWVTFANYLALACFFWSTRDWLMGKTRSENVTQRTLPTLPAPKYAIPMRLRRLLWVLALNGAMLAAVSIVQRLDGGGKLLWLVEPRINRQALLQLGPYAYRANGAQYFNLLWPTALGLWWLLRREARRKRGDNGTTHRAAIPYPILLPAVLLMVVCPIISTSRGGAIVATAGVFGCAVIIISGLRRRSPATKFSASLCFGAMLAAGVYFGGDQLSLRLRSTEIDLLARENIYATARDMVRDYPLFGTGPGSFESVFQLYRSSTDEYWPAQLHNDWLETLVTFGWCGSSLIVLALACIVGRLLNGGSIRVPWRFIALVWVGLLGCLAHARFDFPFQVYSILHLFLLECAILFTLARDDVAG